MVEETTQLESQLWCDVDEDVKERRGIVLIEGEVTHPTQAPIQSATLEKAVVYLTRPTSQMINGTPPRFSLLCLYPSRLVANSLLKTCIFCDHSLLLCMDSPTPIDSSDYLLYDIVHRNKIADRYGPGRLAPFGPDLKRLHALS